MRTPIKTLLASAAVLSLAAATATTAQAHDHHHHHHGAGAAALVGGILIGGAIAAGAERERRYQEDEAYARCEEDFRSFDPRTGTIINRYGEERLCPYLR